MSKYVNKSQWMPPRLPTGRPQTSITSPLLTATRPPSHAGLPELSQLGSGGYPQSLEAKMYKKEDGFPRPPSPALGGLQIPRWLGSNPLSAWWLGLAPATLEFWVRFPNERNQGKQAHPVEVPGSSLVPSNKHTHLPQACWRYRTWYHRAMGEAPGEPGGRRVHMCQASRSGNQCRGRCMHQLDSIVCLGRGIPRIWQLGVTPARRQR